METGQHPPMNGDDDLAKTLDEGLQFEETPVSGDSPAPSKTKDIAAAEAPTIEPLDEPAESDEPPAIRHAGKQSGSSGSADEGLEKIKASALEELRPLVSKLDLPADEKFDTLLLIIRTTDDQSLLEEAHAAAKKIGDDKRRAQALLDVVKEIDYFSTKR